MEHLVVFSADLHGNEIQYNKLVDFAKSVSPQSLIIGGDIAPKRGSDRYIIHRQRSFLSERLPSLLSPLKKKLPNCQIYLMMGNDDCACNLDVLERNDTLFHVIHSRRLKLTEDFDVVGYPFVPITPFGIKDWEKYDLSEVPPDLANGYAKRKALNYRLHGFKSTLDGWKKFRFTEAMEKESSIQKDLRKGVFKENPQNTVYVFHTPPNGTHLDQRHDGCHLGSMAVRLFIEDQQPFLTLHGHIHRTVDVSGNFKETISNSVSLSAGNDDSGNYVPNDLAIVTFDLYNLKSTRRVVI